ncbi:hypothetical protein Hanom_Chr04g00295601 [Helianthus anomalus]
MLGCSNSKRGDLLVSFQLRNHTETKFMSYLGAKRTILVGTRVVYYSYTNYGYYSHHARVHFFSKI